MSLLPLSLLAKHAAPILGPQCGRCKLDQDCESPKMKPVGQGRKGIFIVGEAPGKEEDRQGRPFVGPSGELLRKLLLKCGVDLRADCWISNALHCHPENDFIKDKKTIDYCRPLVLDELKRYDPKVVILLGKSAVRSVIGHYWKDDTKGVMRWAGFRIPNRHPNSWFCPTIHPSHVLRKRNKQGAYTDKGLTERWLLGHLEAACALDSRPWTRIPDYESKVRIIEDDEEAASAVRAVTDRGGPVAIDYETTCLKPDGPHARIVCCSVSDGGMTVAYPWIGKAVKATKRLLMSGVPLIASNMKFEARWSEAAFGSVPSGFTDGWDTMVQSHVIDSRPGIASIKFQSYVRLGQEDYDGHLSKFLKSPDRGGNVPNRIKEIDRHDLYRYCGLDSLLEWLVSREQTRELGVKLFKGER